MAKARVNVSFRGPNASDYHVDSDTLKGYSRDSICRSVSKSFA